VAGASTRDALALVADEDDNAWQVQVEEGRLAEGQGQVLEQMGSTW